MRGTTSRTTKLHRVHHQSPTWWHPPRKATCQMPQETCKQRTIPYSQRSGGSSEFDWRCAGTRNSTRLRWIDADQTSSTAADSTQHDIEGALPDDAWTTWGPLITTWRPYAQGMLTYLAFSDSVRRGARPAHLARRSDSDGAQTRAQMTSDHRPLALPQEDAHHPGTTSNATSVRVCMQSEQTRGRREPQRRRRAGTEKSEHAKVTSRTSRGHVFNNIVDRGTAD